MRQRCKKAWAVVRGRVTLAVIGWRQWTLTTISATNAILVKEEVEETVGRMGWSVEGSFYSYRCR